MCAGTAGAVAEHTGDRRRAVLLGLFLFALAFALRSAKFGLVFVDGGVQFPSGNDELYHIRRIVYEALRFPEVLDFDPYVGFPFGARPLWPPYLDWLLAGLARLFMGGESAASIERFVVWMPPLVGAATAAGIGEIARRIFSPLAGLVAGVFVALVPAHFVHSQLGQVDHQVVVDFAVTLLLASGMASLCASSRRNRAALRTGACIAGCFLIWPGSLLHLVPLQAVVVAQLLTSGERSLAVERARAAAVMNGAAAALLLPFCLGRPFEGLGPLSPLVLSRFQPLWLGAGATLCLVVAELWRRSPAGATRSRRIASAFATGVCGLAAALALVPGLLPGVRYAGGWFSHGEAFLANITELKPLLYPFGRFDTRLATGLLSPAFFVFPLAWLWLAYRNRHASPRGWAVWLVLTWAGCFFVLTLAQNRFSDACSLGVGLVLAGATEEVRAAARPRLGARAQRALGAPLAILAIVLVLPAFSTYGPAISKAFRALRQGPPAITGRKAVVEEAARWLRAESPRTLGFLDASLRPEFGILAPWDDGHIVRYRAERPVIQDNFAIFGNRRAFELAGAYFAATDEEEAYRIAQQLRARYAIATYSGSGQTPSSEVASVGQRAWRLLGSSATIRLGPQLSLQVAALAHHRLVWFGDGAGNQPSVGVGAPKMDRVAIFEIVPGAWVEGEADRDAPVTVELELSSPKGRFTYRALIQASADGHYGVRLPYPTDARFSRHTQAAPAYIVRSSGKSEHLEVPEAEVRAGGTLTGPSLRTDRASAALRGSE